MKKFTLIVMITFAAGSLFAQLKVGNNPTTINANSALEIESNSKGLLLPRVALTATNNVAPLAAHVQGMTVYNTATAGTAPHAVTPGYYYNDGAQWLKITSEECINNTYTVIDEATTPPVSPVEYDAYLVKATATGAFAGKENNIATYIGTAWTFVALTECDNIYNATTGITKVYNGGVTIIKPTAPSAFWKLTGNTTTASLNKLGTLNIQPVNFVAGGKTVFQIMPNSLSFQGGTTTASGFRSFAYGNQSKATADYSLAFGNFSFASAIYSIALGFTDTATGNYSIAFGYKNIAAGNVSTAMGLRCGAFGPASFAAGTNASAYGNSSIAFGSQCQAHGVVSTAMGIGVSVYGYGSTGIGSYSSPLTTADPDDYVSTDPLFQIGNGYSISGVATNKNAVNVLKNGFTLINALGTTGYIAPRAELEVLGTGAMIVPVGTSAQRPATAVQGMIRYNTSLSKFEGYDGAAWVLLN